MMNIGWVIACTWRTRPDDLAVAACVIGALHAVGALIGRFCSCVWGYRGVVLVGLFVELDSCDGEEGVMRTGWLPGSAAARCGYKSFCVQTVPYFSSACESRYVENLSTRTQGIEKSTNIYVSDHLSAVTDHLSADGSWAL